MNAKNRTAVLSALVLSTLALSGCPNFMCDHCKSDFAYRQERKAYENAPRQATLPSKVYELKYTWGANIDIHINGNTVILTPRERTPDWRINPDFVYYQGVFVNPMPIVTPKGERYQLDFRLDGGGLDNTPNLGTVYLLDGNGQNPSAKGRPFPAGMFER